MKNQRPIRLPVVVPLAADQVEAELEAAIELVAGGAARRVVIAALPDVEAVAAHALARAQGAGVCFSLIRDPVTGAVSALVEPPER